MSPMIGLSVYWLMFAVNADEQSYFATIKFPVERSIYAPDATIPIHAIILADAPDGRPATKPLVVIQFIKPQKESFVIHQSANATVTRDTKHAERFVIKHDLSRRAPFRPGKYMLRVKCSVNGKEVVTPSRIVEIRKIPDSVARR